MTRDDLILQHRQMAKAFALQIARQYGINSSEIRDEMIQAAELGLVQSAASFDPGRGVQFSTFAWYRIRGSVFTALRQCRGLPTELGESMRESEAFNDAIAPIAERVDAGADMPDRRERAASDSAAFSDAVGRLGAVFALLKSVATRKEDAADSAEPASRASRDELLAALHKSLVALTEEQRQILDLKYRQDLSMSEIGSRLKCDKATVSRKHEAAIDALARALGADRSRAKQGTPPRVTKNT